MYAYNICVRRALLRSDSVHTCMDQYACIPHYVVLASSVQMTKVGPGRPCWEGSPWLVVPVECLFGKKDVLMFVI